MNKRPKSGFSFSPSDIEQHFRDFQASLFHIHNERLRLHRLASYIGGLEILPEDVTYSYLLQLSGDFLFLAANTVLDPAAPDEVKKYLNTVRMLRQRLEQDLRADQCIAARANLLYYLSLNFFYVGELEQGLQALKTAEKMEDFCEGKAAGEAEPFCVDSETKDLIGRLRKDGKAPYDLFHEFVDKAPTTPFIKNHLIHMLDTWTAIEVESGPSSIRCLAVEMESSFDGSSRGKIVRLDVSARPSADSRDQNQVYFNNPFLTTANELVNSASDAVTAADGLYEKKTRRKAPPLFLTFSFPEKDHLYGGGSFGAALALLAYNKKLLAGHHRRYLKFRGNAAITGNVSLRGEVPAIGAEDLKIKIEAAFFSPCRYLFLPKDNVRPVETHLYSLMALFPSKKLGLIGIEHIGDAVMDGRIAIAQKTPFRVFIRQKMSRIVRVILGTVIFTGAVAGLMILTRHPEYHFWKDREPTKLEILKDTIFVRNKANQSLWSYRFDKELFTLSSQGSFIDINSDRKKELLFIATPAREEIMTAMIVCFSNRGKRLWEYVPGRAAKTQKEEFINKFNANLIGVVRPREDDERLILIGASHSPSYPYQVSILSPSGKLIGEYWNSGHFNDRELRVVDIDGDDIKEIVIGGQNNGFQQACLVVFDLRNLRGASPQDETPDYKFFNIEKGTEKYYIRFPQSILCQKFQVRNRVTGIDLYENEKRFEVIVLEDFDVRENYCLRYLFDFQFNLLKVSAEDEYLSRVKELQTQKIIPPEFSERDIAAYKDQVRYWDGDRWTPTPSMNKYWKMAAK